MEEQVRACVRAAAVILAGRCIRLEAEAVSAVEARGSTMIGAAIEARIFAEIKVANPGAAVARDSTAIKTETAQGVRRCAKVWKIECIRV